MVIGVMGLGYLGTTHALAMAEIGHTVIAIDVDENKVRSLQAGSIPFYEPDLEDALKRALAKGSISFSTSLPSESGVEIVFICVGTPSDFDGSANTRYVESAIEAAVRQTQNKALIVGKSTVPVGTAARIRDAIKQAHGTEVRIAWNPEFLREGSAFQDSLSPDRIVIGTNNVGDDALIRSAYAPIIEREVPVLSVNVETAELTKVAANAFLATKISFINAFAELAEKSGADVADLANAIGHDDRIGAKYLKAGIGFGGGCLPKDIRGLIARAEELGVGRSFNFLKSVDDINKHQRIRVVDKVRSELGDLDGRRILVMGLSFKPNTDDMRDSPSLETALKLKGAGAHVTVHDPFALASPQLKDSGLVLQPDIDLAFEGQELCILSTDWEVYRELDPKLAGAKVSQRVVIDGRNVLNIQDWQRAGWKVLALGRNAS